MADEITNRESNETARSLRTRVVFFSLIIALIGAAIVRSSITTSLDSFTFDEAYHIGAGASYVQTGDFRLNPEQPPLTKLWVGSYVTLHGYQVSPYRVFADKNDEREFVEQDAYNKNDPIALQAQNRAAMFALNGLLMLCFALAIWRVFGHVMALSVTLFLAIDPTVAAHMPVMMTDLPVGLTSGTAMLMAVQAFRGWKLPDIIAASAALGLALTAKHSAIITAAAVTMTGLLFALVLVRQVSFKQRIKRLAIVAAVLTGSVVLLWAFYLFRYHETPGTVEETFNRPLATKITDIKSPVYRFGLDTMARAYLLPRAYIWGLADTIRAGAEGRAIPILAFGNMYYSRAPFYYFPGAIGAKLPIGVILLCVAGLGLVILRKIPQEFYAPIAGLAILAGAFLFFLMKGSTYAGVRHALPIYPLLLVVGALPIFYAVRNRSIVLGGASALFVVAAIASAVPVMRPWEYFNEFAGGTENAHRYFSDEGVDLGLRLAEISKYYDENLKPNGEVPFLVYFSSNVERRWRGLDWVGKVPERDGPRLAAENLEGTFIIGGPELSPKLWWDASKPLRDAQPIARFGNVFVYRGKFPRLPSALARTFYFRAVYTKLYVQEPDINAGIELLSKSTELDPTAFHVALELGNQYLKLGNREEALRAYERSLEYAPRTDNISEVLAQQVELLRNGAAGIEPIRNPGVE